MNEISFNRNFHFAFLATSPWILSSFVSFFFFFFLGNLPKRYRTKPILEVHATLICDKTTLCELELQFNRINWVFSHLPSWHDAIQSNDDPDKYKYCKYGGPCVKYSNSCWISHTVLVHLPTKILRNELDERSFNLFHWIIPFGRIYRCNKIMKVPTTTNEYN